MARFIPPGSLKISDKKSDAVAYHYQARNKFLTCVYFGNQSKPVAHYSYGNAAARDKSTASCFAQRQTRMAYRAESFAARKSWINDYKVGEIVNTCWGYDQTNREFYEIVAVKGKRVTIRQLAVTSYATGWAQEKVAPLAGEYIGPPIVKSASARGIKTGRHSFSYATRTSHTIVAGVRVYDAAHTSSYA